ncbi:hypothetical protein [Vagococcus fessus]|uniref:hypothetical protein n=1 Tax=Vagococcus fessus TaxID=120370 RepID=UPI001FE5A7D5|nr:hypothetical protein [Vagococcus fessus]
MAQDWIEKQAVELKATCRDYKELALVDELVRLLDEQDVRIEQLEGQLDGTLWSPSNWR